MSTINEALRELREEDDLLEKKAHDEVVEKIFKPRGIEEIDWSVEEQEDDDGYSYTNIVHFLKEEDWKKLFEEEMHEQEIKGLKNLKFNIGPFSLKYAPYFELDRGYPIFNDYAICFYSFSNN